MIIDEGGRIRQRATRGVGEAHLLLGWVWWMKKRGWKGTFDQYGDLRV